MCSLTLLTSVPIWKQGGSFRFLRCWKPLAPHAVSVTPGSVLRGRPLPRPPKRKGSPAAEAEAAGHAVTSALFQNGGQFTYFSTGVKPPSPPGLHFESGGGFVAGGWAGPPGAAAAGAVGRWARHVGNNGAGLRNGREKDIGRPSRPRWKEWEALARWKGSIIHEAPHGRLHAPASADR